MIKKVLKITGITLLSLIVILFAAPFFFKGKIIALVKSEINKSINAQADFADADVSLFRHFPRVSLMLNDLRIIGIDNFSKDTLFSAPKIDVALDLMSVIKGSNYKVYSISVDQPRIHAIVDKNGKANWDIAKEDTAATTPTDQKPFKMQLQRYEIRDAYVAYRDESSNMSSDIYNLNHSGSGDFTADEFTLTTETNADAVDFSYGGIPFLADTRVKLNADIKVDNKTSTYGFTTDQILLNQLQLAAKGFFRIVNDSTYNMDINFNAPSTDFKNILSLVPAIYQKDFDKVKTSGKATFDGFVKGTMAGETLPAYTVNLNVDNGFFQYPDLPAPLKSINIQMKVENPDGVTDHTVVDIPKGHFELNNDPFDFRINIIKPVSDMFIDAAAKGRLDLSKIGQLVKLDKGVSLGGLLQADVAVKGSVEAAEKQQYDRFNASGNMGITDLKYVSPDYPSGINLNKLLMSFNPKNVTVSEVSGKYMSTSFTANGVINNLLGYALKDYPLDGTLNVVADKVNVNELMPSSSADTVTTTSSEAFVVPGKMNITLNAKAGQVHYDKTDITNVLATMKLADEKIQFDNISGNAFDGTLAMSGSYSTKESKTNPEIALAYKIKDVDVQKSFMALNTMQKLMPIGKFLGGKLSSELTATGNLKDGLTPDLSSLSGNGNLFLIEGLLRKFEPIDKLATRLQIDALKEVSLREVRQHFEFANGKVLIKPFKIRVKDIDMEVAGMHGLDQSLDYSIDLKVPRSLMGNKGNEAVNDLIAKATSRGIPVKVSDVVDLHVKMKGTITSPDIQLDLKQTANSVAEDLKTQAKEFAAAAADSAKKAVKDTLTSLKNEAVKEATDKLKSVLSGSKDSTAKKDSSSGDPKKRAEDAAKGLIKDINPFKKKKSVDSTQKH